MHTNVDGIDSVLFLLLSLFIIAASLYLPEHMTIIANRMFYYWFGDEESGSKSVQQVLTSSSRLIGDAATSLFGKDTASAQNALNGPGRAFMEP